VIQLLQKVYFSRYQQAIERSLSSRRHAQKAVINKSACSEDSVPGKLEPGQPAGAEEQSCSITKDIAREHAGKSVINGFKEIAPGIYQFFQFTPGGKGYGAPPKLFPIMFNPGQPHSKCEPEFQRVDGLPGPYQHYSTPVFQFT